MQEQDRIIKINIEEEMKSSYIDYSMSVIVARALPDVRDGFKPVHRPQKDEEWRKNLNRNTFLIEMFRISGKSRTLAWFLANQREMYN